MAEERRRLLTPTEIAWRERLGDHEFYFRPTEVKFCIDPADIDLDGIKDQAEFEYVQRIYGPQHKTVQYTRTVRLSLD